MKKVMLGFVAAAAIAAFGAAIESANTVGFQNQTLTDGVYNWFCHTFKAVDGRLWTLADLIPGENYSSSKIQFLTGTGATKKFTLANSDEVYGEFEYYRAEDFDGAEELLPDGASAVAGWYLWDAAGEKLYLMNSVSIPEGGGFMVDALDGDEATIGGAGQVDTEDTDCVLVDGIYNWYGNCSPVDLTLGDIAVNENFSSSKIQFLTGAGATKKFTLANNDEVYGEFEYYRAEDFDGAEELLPDGASAVAGWYLWDAAGEKLYLMNNVSIPAGAGFMVDALDGDDACVIVPSAL